MWLIPRNIVSEESQTLTSRKNLCVRHWLTMTGEVKRTHDKDSAKKVHGKNVVIKTEI